MNAVSNRQQHRVFALLSAGYFIFLLVFLSVYGYTPVNDTEGYLAYANACLQHNDIYPSAWLFKGEAFIWHPGPINMIIWSLKWFGSTTPLLVLYCLMKALTVFFIAEITIRFSSFRTALTAALLFMCYPNNWGQSTMLLSEIPMICLMMAALCLVLHAEKIWLMALAGIIMALANWFRPIAGIFLIALFIWFLLFRRTDILRKWLPLMGGYMLLILLIGWNSYYRTGHFIYQSESFWYNMADDCYDGATPDPHFGQPLFQKGTPRYIENRQELTCFECEQIWRQRCTEWLKNHKTDYLKKLPWSLLHIQERY